MKTPGDVVKFYSAHAGKPKFHLCVNVGGKYIYLSSVREHTRTYAADYVYSCSNTPFLTATETDTAYASCDTFFTMSDEDLKRRGAEKLGGVGRSFLLEIYEFVDANDAITEDDKEIILGGLGDYL